MSFQLVAFNTINCYLWHRQSRMQLLGLKANSRRFPMRIRQFIQSMFVP